MSSGKATSAGLGSLLQKTPDFCNGASKCAEDALKGTAKGAEELWKGTAKGAEELWKGTAKGAEELWKGTSEGWKKAQLLTKGIGELFRGPKRKKGPVRFDEKANKAIRTPKDQWYQVSPAWRNVTSAPGAEEIQWSAFDQKYEGKCFQYNEVPSLGTPLLKHEVGEIIRVGPATGQTCGDQVVWAQKKEYV